MKEINNTITQAQILLGQGKFKDALSLLDTTSKKQKKSADYLFLVATCHAQIGNFSIAERYYFKTTRLSPVSVQSWSNLGLTQLHQEKYKKAIQSFKKAHNINPEYYDAIYNLALTYYKLSDVNNSIKYANLAVKSDNSRPQAYNVLGLCHQNENANIAISYFKKAINANTQQFDTYHNLIDTYILHNDEPAAEELILSLLPHHPSQIYLYTKLGELYEKQKYSYKAIEIYNKGLEIYPENTTLLTSLGRNLILINEFDKAIKIIDKALSISPNDPEPIIEKYTFLLLRREYQASYKLLKEYIDTNKTTIDARLLIAFSNTCKLINHEQEGIDALTQITCSNLNNETSIGIHYMLGDLNDKLGQYEIAFENYTKSNALNYKKSDIEYYLDSMSSIISSIDKKTLKRLSGYGSLSTSPVFIVGMPRSGTSLVEQIISTHPDVYGAGEITHLWEIGNKISNAMNLINYSRNLTSIHQEQINKFCHGYLEKTAELSNGESYITDKLPHNFIHIGLIELLFPNAKIIHCQRHPFDTCLSIYFKKFNDNHIYSNSLEDLARFYKKYMELMEHWYKNSSLSILTVNYERLVTNQEDESKRIIDHIGLSWDKNVLRYFDSERIIMTPSYNQASKPMYTDSLYRWKNYSSHTEPLSNILGTPKEYI